jgi:tetratricopeptide (TPR) repeat protein
MARLILILVALAVVTPAADAQRSEMLTYMERISRAHEAQDWNGVIHNARRMRTHEAWRKLPAHARWPVLVREGEALARIGAYQRSRNRLLEALRLTRGADRGGPLFYLFATEYAMEDWRSAARRLLELQEIFPSQFDDIRYSALDRVVTELDQSGETRLHDALVTLIATEYQPDDPTPHLDWMLLRYVRILVASGELGAAMGQAERVLYADARVELRTLGVYAPLWSNPSFDHLTDPRAGEEANLQRNQIAAAANPRSLAPVSAQLYALMALGRLDEARALAEATLAQVSTGEQNFDHVDHWTRWLMDSAARILYAQGRVQEADAWMTRAVALPENGGPNVSQVINYATLLSYQDRQEDALAMLERLEEASLPVSDLMWVWSLQACAQHRLGRPDARDIRLAQLESDWRVNAPAYQRALVCLGDLDAAAALLVARLGNPQLRADALAALQDRPLLISAEVLPLAAELQADFRALRQRPEVLAAIAEHGRIERVGLYQPSLGKF